MGAQSTVFSQLLKLVPRYEFDRLAQIHHAGRKRVRITVTVTELIATVDAIP